MNPHPARWALLALATLLATAVAQEPVTEASAPGRQVTVIDIQGAIGPATTDYLVRSLEDAGERGDAALVIRMDTPGGLDAATRDINRAILAAETPVLTFVAPEGARAASAGTYILYASHLAAMAPATNLGAATPVPIGGAAPGAAPQPGGDEAAGEDREEGAAPAPGGAMGRKVVNDSAAYIRGLAELRGRNAEWAEQAVREAVSLTASEALEEGVVEIVAADLAELLEQADGRTVRLHGGETVLATAGAAVRVVAPDWRNRLLARITDPTVAYLLFLIGLYGLLLEGYNPGVLVPGVVGAICLILALYAFQVLPINYAGLALIVLGILLMVAEAFAPSFGVLGIGGIVALTIGSLILLDPSSTGLSVSRAVIGAIAAVSGAAFLTLSLALIGARRRPVITGADALIGARARVIEQHGDVLRVHLFGEDWRARSSVPLAVGEEVRVTGKDGLVLDVTKSEGERT